jgi:hypothetical protein
LLLLDINGLRLLWRVATLLRITALLRIALRRVALGRVATLMLRRWGVIALLVLRVGKETTITAAAVVITRGTRRRSIVVVISASRRSWGWAVVVIAVVKGLVCAASLSRWRMSRGLSKR